MSLALTSLPGDNLGLRVVIGSCRIGETERRVMVPWACVDSGSETGTSRVGNVILYVF
jgi:hypothetical protein